MSKIQLIIVQLTGLTCRERVTVYIWRPTPVSLPPRHRCSTHKPEPSRAQPGRARGHVPFALGRVKSPRSPGRKLPPQLAACSAGAARAHANLLGKFSDLLQFLFKGKRPAAAKTPPSPLACQPVAGGLFQWLRG